MAFVALPPELRSLCRKLTETKVEQLPNLLPVLLKDVHRCQGPLSAPQDSKASANSSEVALLVHKLRTHITTLLNGRSVEGRFTAVCLVKAAVEAGGWECLRNSEPWVRGLLSILQKRDPVVTKELSIVTLTNIYLMVQGYQTLIREMATPTLPAFATACLQMLKPMASNKTMKLPTNVIETVFEALSTLIPLYHTTLRPFGNQIRSAARPYLAPTTSDGLPVPATLQSSSRRLVIRLHMTTAKAGGSEEWLKHLNRLIKEFHATADEVFRAVLESWESTTGYTHQKVDFDLEPHGRGASPEQLPQWTGIQAGSERMIGLVNFIADYFRCSTKVPVTVPISAITDLITRISSIMPPTPGRDKFGSVQLNAAVGREEKDELWSVFPDIQIAALNLVLAMLQRLGRNFVPLAQDTLQHTLRMYETGYRLPEFRFVSFSVVKEMLFLRGPTLSKTNVDALTLVIKSCCRDLLAAAGHIKAPKQQAQPLPNGSKSKHVSQNADAFLSSRAEEEYVSVSFGTEHITAAEELLAAFFSHLPQQHINSSLRSYMLKTAVLCRIKNAQVASILHPSRDKNGKTPQVVLPHLHQQFPRDESVEILRFNFRPMMTGTKDDFMSMDFDDEPQLVAEEVPTNGPANGFSFDHTSGPSVSHSQMDTIMEETAHKEATAAISVPPMKSVVVPEKSPFLPQPTSKVAVPDEAEIASQSSAGNPLKRKIDEADEPISKHVEMDVDEASIPDPDFRPASTLVEYTLQHSEEADKGKEEEMEEADSDDESVHLNMDLDSDDEDT